jgi:hypothetical protein
LHQWADSANRNIGAINKLWCWQTVFGFKSPPTQSPKPLAVILSTKPDKFMIKREHFATFLSSINSCYPEEFQEKLPDVKDFSDVFTDEKVDPKKLEYLADNSENIYLKSVAFRLIGIAMLQMSRDGETILDLKNTWRYITKSIRVIPLESIISTIGSQGFLSIPLFKFDNDMSMFELIRLHIWDKSLEQHINQNATKNFSIHTHSFHAHSWIITGKIINDRYIVTKASEPTDYVRFKINYNKSLSKVNRHTSTATNDDVYVNPKQISHEVYMSGGTYQIKAENYHNSGTEDEDGLAATFFSFTAKNGKVETSYVVGPSNSQESEINRRENIDPIYLLDKIEAKQIDL